MIDCLLLHQEEYPSTHPYLFIPWLLFSSHAYCARNRYLILEPLVISDSTHKKNYNLYKSTLPASTNVEMILKLYLLITWNIFKIWFGSSRLSRKKFEFLKKYHTAKLMNDYFPGDFVLGVLSYSNVLLLTFNADFMVFHISL